MTSAPAGRTPPIRSFAGPGPCKRNQSPGEARPSGNRDPPPGILAPSPFRRAEAPSASARSSGRLPARRDAETLRAVGRYRVVPAIAPVAVESDPAATTPAFTQRATVAAAASLRCDQWHCLRIVREKPISVSLPGTGGSPPLNVGRALRRRREERAPTQFPLGCPALGTRHIERKPAN